MTRRVRRGKLGTAVFVAVLAGCGLFSAWLLPVGWRLASLPVALVCATAAKRLVGEKRVEGNGKGGEPGGLRRDQGETSDMNEPSWYGVRCVFRHRHLEVYEERVTLWTARSLEEAIARAESEAAEYCEALDEVEYTDFAEAYAMSDSPEEGAEVFSLMRESGLPPGEYVRRFFATGEERTG